MKTHPDQRYIEALLNNDKKLIAEIYSRFSRKIKRYILQNSGTEDDAADIFQEALIDLYQQAKHKSLQLSCPFEPFLLLLCRRRWLNGLKKRTIIPVTNSEDALLNISEDVFEAVEEIEKQQMETEIYMDALENLGGRCREIIAESLKGEAQEKTAEKLGVSYGYLRKKKSECMAALIKLIRKKQ